MAAHLQTKFSIFYIFQENIHIWIQISMKFVPKASIEDKSALDQVMACRLTGDKPLPEPMLTMWCHWATLS